jgi:hypothetical protein
MLNKKQAINLANDTIKGNRPEMARLRRFERYYRGKQKLPWMPDNVESEYRDIADKSQTNWLQLVVRSSMQALIVDGYGTDAGASPLWDIAWQRNGMDSLQMALHEATLVLGYSYMLFFPSDDDGVWVCPESATRVSAVYEDPRDEWPTHAVREVSKTRTELYDGDARYIISGSGAGQTVEVAEHDFEHPPVVQMRLNRTLLGSPLGEIEPNIPTQDRIRDATFMLQVVAKYGGFPQKWIAGLDLTKPLTGPDGLPILDGNGNPIFPTIKAYVDHILAAVDPETKFGQFEAADLGQYETALEAHIRHLAATTQTPPHYLLGSLVNLSAEALAAAEAGHMRKTAGYATVLGEGHEQWLRGCGAMLDLDEADDTSSQVHWADVESRSLAQTADALLKLNQLGLPLQVLIPMIPGLAQQDREAALAVVGQGDPMQQIAAMLDNARHAPPELNVA